MTPALQTATKEDGVTPADPFDDGAGSIRADRAVQPTLTFDVPASDFVAAENDRAAGSTSTSRASMRWRCRERSLRTAMA
jgi:hypothetical protein